MGALPGTFGGTTGEVTGPGEEVGEAGGEAGGAFDGMGDDRVQSQVYPETMSPDPFDLRVHGLRPVVGQREARCLSPYGVLDQHQVGQSPSSGWWSRTRGLSISGLAQATARRAVRRMTNRAAIVSWLEVVGAVGGGKK